MSEQQMQPNLSDRKTISKEAAEILRWRIIRGEIASGERLAEEKLGKTLGISRGPVREALRELERDGLVVVEPYRGAIVLDISVEDLRGVLLPVRHVLEQRAVEHALAELDDRDFAILDEIVEHMASVVATGGPDILRPLVELDVSFHSYLIDKFGGVHARHVWASISPRVLAGFYRLGALHSHPDAIVIEHRELLQALRTRDLAVARDALADHIIASPIRLLATNPVGALDD